MFSKYSLSLLVVGLFVFSFIAFSSPQKAFAGANGLGCCINKSNNCVMCGTGESFCQTEQNGSCKDVTTSDLCDGTQDLNGCFVPGAVCFQDTNIEGTCGDAPEEGGCTNITDCESGGKFDDGDECTADTCEANGVCSHVFDGSLSDSCVPPPPLEPAGPLTIIPTMGQWGMIIVTVLLGFFAVRMLRNRKDSEI